MNSDLDCAADDDEEEKAPEPPLRSLRFFDALESSTSNSTLTVTTNTKNLSESFLDHSTELPEYSSYRGDDLEDGDGGGYDSDRIDPDLEELLYASVHHQTTDTMELSYVNGSDPQTVNDPKSNNKNNNNPQESEHLIPQSDAPNSQCIIFNNRRVAKKDLKRLKKVSSTPNLTSSRPSFTESQLDLSFGNISSTTSVMMNTTATSIDELNPFAAMMSKFYNEDSYDSEEEFRKKARMSKDKRFWKVDQEDLMAGFGRRSLNQPRFGRAASPKKPCRACGGFGHLVKECPRKLICNICGSSKHSGNRCRERVCAICFEPGHQSHKCPVRYDLKQLNCSVCKLVGHTGNQCTLNWRKFLNITDPAQYEEMMKQNVIHEDTVTFNERISCYNCAETGRHFAFECPQKTMDNLRYQIPPPVANWKALRKGRNSAKSSNQKTPKRKAESTPRRSFANVPSPSTSTPYFSIPSSTESSSGASTPPNNPPQPKGSKRPLNGFSKYPESSSSEPEIIQISSGDDDDDSIDSMDYVLNLLKNSTEVNDEPMNGSKSYTPKRNNKKARASYADSLMHLNVSLGSKKKKKDNRLEQQAKEEKKRARIQYNKRNYQGQKVQRGGDQGTKDKSPKNKSPRNKSPRSKSPKKAQKANNNNQTPKIKNVSNKRKSKHGHQQAGPSGSNSDSRSNKTKKRATYRHWKKARSAT